MLTWSKNKLAGSRGFKFWFVLSIVMTLSAPLNIFEPYDWLQRGFSEELNRKAYEGDSTIIAIDRETVESLDGKVWTRTALANLIGKLSEADVKRVYVFQQNFGAQNHDGKDRLAIALTQLKERAVWYVDLPNSRLFDLDRVTEKEGESLNSENPGTFPSKEIELLVEQSSWIYDQTPFGTPISLPWATSWRGKTFPSISDVMAGNDEPIHPVSHWFGAQEVVDTSYDVDSIPTISAAQIQEGEFRSEQINGRNVVIADMGDLVFTPQKTATPKSAIAILASQTITDGPQYQLYVWSGLIIALVASFAWTALPHPIGRLVALGSFGILLLSPLVLERFLIYQNTSHGLFFLIVFAIGRSIIRSREALTSSRSIAETKSRFLAQASHDLRQPIHAIGLLAERLQQTDLTEPQKDIVAKISWSTGHASRMFKSLLDLAILESGTLKPKLSAVPVNDLLVEIDNQNALIAEQANVNLRFVPSEIILFTDRALANTMLQNLVSNAIKYSNGGDILVGCRRMRRTVALCVYDQGPGISEKEVQMVSQEFYRGQKLDVAGADGVGLGLAIVRGLADLLNLNFVLKSNRGNGTVARIGGFSMASLEENLSPAADLEDSDLLAGKQVLAIDDDIETLQSTAGLLDMWGCQVRTATEMPKGELSDYDIILTDFDFGNGVTLAAFQSKIMELRSTGMCIVIVSGHHPSHIDDKMGNAGVTILAKPVNPNDLRSALTAELLQNRFDID